MSVGLTVDKNVNINRNDCDRRAHRDHDRSEGEEKNDHAQTHQETRLGLKSKEKEG